MKTDRTIPLMLCLLGLALCQTSQGLSVSSSAVGGVPTGADYFFTFDDAPSALVGASGSWASLSTDGLDSVFVTATPNALVVQGAQSGQYAAPYLSGGQGALFGSQPDGVDQTTYLTSGTYPSPGGSIELQFNAPQRYLGLLWGSVDDYNSLEFYLGSTLIGTVVGDDVAAGNNGNQSANGTYYVNINSAAPFDTVVAKSSQFAFEFDNVAIKTTNVPDGGSTVMLVGISMMAMGLFRRRMI
jgi:hypothetical protein